MAGWVSRRAGRRGPEPHHHPGVAGRLLAHAGQATVAPGSAEHCGSGMVAMKLALRASAVQMINSGVMEGGTISKQPRVSEITLISSFA